MNSATKRVVETIARHFHIETADLLSRDRHKTIALARQISMYVLREYQKPQPSFPELGKEFADRDHTTVMSAVRHIVRIASDDDVVRGAIEAGRDALALTFADGEHQRFLAKRARRRELEREMQLLDAELSEEQSHDEHEEHEASDVRNINGRQFLDATGTSEG